MDLRELRAFVAVVEEGGLSAAARRLHVSQSALSQTVQTMERRLGAALLTRSHTGVRTTDLGALVLPEARAVLARYDRAMGRIADAVRGSADGTSSGVLRIGAPLELPADVLPAALVSLARTHPQTRVEVRHASSTVQLGALRTQDLDLALVRDRPADDDLDSVLAVEEAMGVIVSTACAAELADERGVRLERLAGMRWSGFARSDTPAWHDQVTATLRGHGIVVPVGDTDDGPVTAEVKLATVGTGRAFALAAPNWGSPLPEGMSWHQLIGDPIVRRTWAVWRMSSRQRDLAALVDALDGAVTSAQRTFPGVG